MKVLFCFLKITLVISFIFCLSSCVEDRQKGTDSHSSYVIINDGKKENDEPYESGNIEAHSKGKNSGINNSDNNGLYIEKDTINPNKENVQNFDGEDTPIKKEENSNTTTSDYEYNDFDSSETNIIPSDKGFFSPVV